MSLSDGTFLVSPTRYDYLVKVSCLACHLHTYFIVVLSCGYTCALCSFYNLNYPFSLQSGQTVEELTARGLKRVSPAFRVIALGLPVPEVCDVFIAIATATTFLCCCCCLSYDSGFGCYCCHTRSVRYLLIFRFPIYFLYIFLCCSTLDSLSTLHSALASKEDMCLPLL